MGPQWGIGGRCACDRKYVRLRTAGRHWCKRSGHASGIPVVLHRWMACEGVLALPPLLPPQGWSRFTTGPFELHEVEGHHLWPLEKGSKAVWLGMIAAQLEQLGL